MRVEGGEQFVLYTVGAHEMPRAPEGGRHRVGLRRLARLALVVRVRELLQTQRLVTIL